MRKSLFFLSMICCSSNLLAQTLLQRVEMKPGSPPLIVNAIFLQSGWEGWTFQSQGKVVDAEAGKLFPVGKHLLLGGYAALWPQPSKLFVIPWAAYNAQVAGGALNVNFAAYLPVNGGPGMLFSDESSIVWPASKRLQLGLVGSYWKKPGSEVLRSGLTLHLKYQTVALKINWQPLILVGKGPSTVRLQLIYSFR